MSDDKIISAKEVQEEFSRALRIGSGALALFALYKTYKYLTEFVPDTQEVKRVINNTFNGTVYYGNRALTSRTNVLAGFPHLGVEALLWMSSVCYQLGKALRPRFAEDEDGTIVQLDPKSLLHVFKKWLLMQGIILAGSSLSLILREFLIDYWIVGPGTLLTFEALLLILRGKYNEYVRYRPNLLANRPWMRNLVGHVPILSSTILVAGVVFNALRRFIEYFKLDVSPASIAPDQSRERNIENDADDYMEAVLIATTVVVWSSKNYNEFFVKMILLSWFTMDDVSIIPDFEKNELLAYYAIPTGDCIHRVRVKEYEIVSEILIPQMNITLLSASEKDDEKNLKIFSAIMLTMNELLDSQFEGLAEELLPSPRARPQNPPQSRFIETIRY